MTEGPVCAVSQIVSIGVSKCKVAADSRRLKHTVFAWETCSVADFLNLFIFILVLMLFFMHACEWGWKAGGEGGGGSQMDRMEEKFISQPLSASHAYDRLCVCLCVRMYL